MPHAKVAFISFMSVAGLGAAVLLMSCGTSTTTPGAGFTISGLDQIPSASSILADNGVNASRLAAARSAVQLHVSGTPPTLVSLTSSNVDTYFWNGMIAAINTAGSATQQQANNFWGGNDGQPGGQGACYMAQGVGEAVGRILSAGTSACYMKNMPNATSGVTLTGATAATLFAQEAGDRLVKVAVTGHQDEGGGGGGDGSMNVWIKVSGTNTVGTDVYQVELWFCDASGSGEPNGHESIVVNRATGSYTTTNRGTHEGGVHQETITATLKAGSDGNLAFDPTKDRNATAFGSFQGGLYKGQIAVNAEDIVRAKRYHSHSQGGGGSDKNYSIAAYSGGALSTLRFLQAAYKGQSSWNNDSHSYSGATEYRDTHYVSIATSDLKTEVDAFSFSSDTFFTDLTAPSIDLSGYSCSGTPDATVTMDFTDAGVQAIADSCEADRYDNYSLCNGSAIQQAMQHVFNGMGQ